MEPIETPDQDAEPPHLSERGRQNLAWARSLAGQARHDRERDAEREGLLREIRAEKEHLETAARARAEHLETEAERWKKQAEHAQAEADHLREQLAAAETAARRADVAAHEKAARLSVLQQELSDNDRRIEELEDRLAHASLHGHGGPAEEKVKELSERLAAAEQAVLAWQLKLEDAEKVHRDIEAAGDRTWKARLDSAAVETETWRARARQLEAHGPDLSDAAQQAERALKERELAAAARERALEDRARAQEDDHRRKLGEFQDRVAQASLRAQGGPADEKLKSLAERLAAAEQSGLAWKARLEAAEKAHEDIRAAGDRTWQARLDALASEAQTLRARVRELDERGVEIIAAAQRDGHALHDRDQALLAREKALVDGQLSVEDRERGLDARERAIKDDFQKKQGQLEDLKAEFRREVLRLREGEDR